MEEILQLYSEAKTDRQRLREGEREQKITDEMIELRQGR